LDKGTPTLGGWLRSEEVQEEREVHGGEWWRRRRRSSSSSSRKIRASLRLEIPNKA
jgi:hypothetical protein